ncbi:MAG: tetratricopeptide repeat protein [Verrucomicrobiota bacterium]
MLTTKKRVGKPELLFLLLAMLLGLGGCTPPGPRALLDGEQLIQSEKYGEAIEQLRKATALMPNHAQAWNHLGLAYHKANLPREAGESYRKALAVTGGNLAPARYNLGCLLLEQNRAADAANEFTTYTLLQPKSTDGWLMLGTAHCRARRGDEAEKAFKQAALLNPKLAAAWNGMGMATMFQRNKVREANNYFTTALQIQPDYRPALLNLAVVQHVYLSNRVAALPYYQRYLAASGPRPYDYDVVAGVIRQIEHEMAPPPPKPLVTNSPPPTISVGKPTPTNSIPVTTVSTNRPSALPVREVAKTNAVVLFSPPPPVVVRPTANVDLQPMPPAKPPEPVVRVVTPPSSPVKPEAAKPSVTDLVDVPAKNNTAAMVEPARMETPGVKRYTYQRPTKPVAGDRKSALTFFSAGIKAHRDKRWTEALQGYEAAIRADPVLYEAHYNAGLVAIELSDLPRAFLAFETALALNADAAEARASLASALQQGGFFADAAEELERALQANLLDTRARLQVANLYAQHLGRPAKAREHYLELLKQEPQHPQSPAIRHWLMQNQ